MNPAVIAAVIGVGGTVIVGVSGYWASVRNTSQTIVGAQRSRIWDRRDAQRAEVKSAIVSYLEVAQHLQTQLYAREHGQDIPDIPIMVEQLWLAQKQVDIICSEELRKPIERHAAALNEVARHEREHSDWWEFVSPYSESLLNAMRTELKWSDVDLYQASGKSSAVDLLTHWLHNWDPEQVTFSLPSRRRKVDAGR